MKIDPDEKYAVEIVVNGQTVRVPEMRGTDLLLHAFYWGNPVVAINSQHVTCICPRCKKVGLATRPPQEPAVVFRPVPGGQVCCEECCEVLYEMSKDARRRRDTGED